MSSIRLFASLAAAGLLLATGSARAQPAPASRPAVPPGYAVPPQPGSVPPGYAPPGYAPPGYAPPGYAPYAGSQGWATQPDPFPFTPMKRQSSGMIGGGIVLISLGSVGLIAGAGMVAGGSNTSFDCSSGFCMTTNADSTMKYGGVACIVVSLVAMGAGIPILVVGSQKVPDRGEASRALPTVQVGAGGTSLTWRF